MFTLVPNWERSCFSKFWTSSGISFLTVETGLFRSLSLRIRSSVWRTFNPLWMMLFMAALCAAGFSKPSKARPCPSLILPSAMASSTSAGSLRSRMVLVTAVRLFPTRMAISSWESPNSSANCWYASAASIEERSSRCRFSINASSNCC